MGWNWRNGFQEVANTKPLFLTIYATVIIGVIFSSFYVFSAIYSKPLVDSSISWLSSPPSAISSHSMFSLFQSLYEFYFAFTFIHTHLGFKTIGGLISFAFYLGCDGFSILLCFRC